MKIFLIFIFLFISFSGKAIFKSLPLSSEIQSQIIANKLWEKGCPLPLSQLRLLYMSYFDFNGKIRTGSLLVHHSLATSTLHIFQELYRQKFPIEKMDYLDLKNLRNTIAFNCRKKVARESFSLHSYGLAIDINPMQNPYIRRLPSSFTQLPPFLEFFPPESFKFQDRQQKQIGMIEPYVSLFKKHGFSIWGGDWTNPKDYMHFQSK
ncbi:MAG: M15 family metallopeptidase [Alphaproteobacteria bacterium]|nr:M15 family metallopeptidase [Alphaproteobacteria bacterium]